MNIDQTDERFLVRFILGRASEEERAEIEDHSLSDDEFFERLVEVENDLVDAYARGQLVGREREEFENYYLATKPGRDRIKFARAMTHAVPMPSTVQTLSDSAHVGVTSWWATLLQGVRDRGPILQYSVVAVGLLIVFGAAWLLFESLRGRAPQPEQKASSAPASPPASTRESPTPEQTRAPEDQARQESHPNVDQPPSPKLPSKPSSQPIVATFVLSPGLVREGGTSNNLEVPSGTTWVRLQLNLDQDNHGKYFAALSTAEGRKVWTGNESKARAGRSGAPVNLNLPAHLLKRGEYVLELKGATSGGALESVAEYSFRVVRK